ncbi:hypothetical protein EDB81DRAFT_951668 [Dactylonectria macrodidyma]|uniref:Uncharacterized protein n=1 Tax=Dactylonectria macrodidyma TaxID=307937 RepID=A0A9P9DUC2_9HYPO|nr:hypothetical protein EDB81DRAFT_951668 [Dactylonectria macrodidyma]
MLKKDYIPDLGDTADFVIIGGRRDAGDEHKLGIGSLWWTSFYIGCIENKDEACRFNAKLRFRIIGTIDRHGISKENITYLNRHGCFTRAPFAKSIPEFERGNGSENNWAPRVHATSVVYLRTTSFSSSYEALRSNTAIWLAAGRRTSERLAATRLTTALRALRPRTCPPPPPGFDPARAQHLPAKVLGVRTATFSYDAEQPTTNPDFSVWLLMNAVKGASSVGIPAIDKTKEIRSVIMNTKTDAHLKSTPYKVNLRNSQNCDAILRYMYGDEREGTDRCSKCMAAKGALPKCVIWGTFSCANCDWNRSGAVCSLAPAEKRGTKRKSANTGMDGGDSDSDDTDPFEDLDRKTCLKISQIFLKAADLKKKKKKKKRSG